MSAPLADGIPLLPIEIALAMRRPTEMTLRAMLASFGWSAEEDLLSSVLRLGGTLEAAGLETKPALGIGGMDDARVLLSVEQPEALGLSLAEIAAGEGAAIEFKSTLLLNTRQWALDPQPPLSTCRCEKVIKSALKTISAFLNTSGGVLLVGIADDGGWYGLQDDMALADPAKSDFDGWELECRRIIDKIFGDPSVNSYVSVARVESKGKVAARIQVAERSRLSFIKTPAGDELYIRSGNRSIPISYRDINEYFDFSKKYV